MSLPVTRRSRLPRLPTRRVPNRALPGAGATGDEEAPARPATDSAGACYGQRIRACIAHRRRSLVSATPHGGLCPICANRRWRTTRKSLPINQNASVPLPRLGVPDRRVWVPMRRRLALNRCAVANRTRRGLPRQCLRATKPPVLRRERSPFKVPAPTAEGEKSLPDLPLPGQRRAASPALADKTPAVQDSPPNQFLLRGDAWGNCFRRRKSAGQESASSESARPAEMKEAGAIAEEPSTRRWGLLGRRKPAGQTSGEADQATPVSETSEPTAERKGGLLGADAFPPRPRVRKRVGTRRSATRKRWPMMCPRLRRGKVHADPALFGRGDAAPRTRDDEGRWR
ncbi:MAG: hypothetical protein KatS3mg051_0730 [Anaerolineae bacterium]|nr:MAG: hypothetical protein KatS3mg051_0730 [Anaerolineae bacterium]